MTDEGLTAGAVARRLGVAVTTLRTWHQRYGLGPSEHVPGHHRRYTPEDFDRLRVMRRLTAQGVAPAEAAAWARRAPLPAASPVSAPPDDSASSSVSSSAGAPPGAAPASEPGASSSPPAGAAASSPPAAVPASSASAQVATSSASAGDSAAVSPEAGAPSAVSAGAGSSAAAPPPAPSPPGGPPRTGRQGGGQIIALGPRATPAARGLARAAMHLDAPAMREVLATAIGEHGVIGAWSQAIMPVLIGIGERYQVTRRFVEVEHLLSRCITEALGAVPRPGSGVIPRVLLAAADEEQHTLPLEALAAALAEAGVPTNLLGPRVPTTALADAVNRTGPDVLVLWSQTPDTGDPAQLTRLASTARPPLMTAVAGPGWPADLPPGVSRLTSLPEATAAIIAAVFPGHSPGHKKGIPI